MTFTFLKSNTRNNWTVITLLAMCFMSQASATLIDNGSYTTDDVSQLDWLDLTTTANLSIDEALAQNVGWTLATRTQFEILINQLDTVGDNNFLDIAANAPSNNIALTTPGAESFISDSQEEFTSNIWFSLLGLSGSSLSWTCGPSVCIPVSLYYYSLGLYGDPSQIYLGGVRTITDAYGTYDVGNIFRNCGIVCGNYQQSEFVDGVGVFLIRQTGNVEVPAPTTLSIFALGIIGLGLRRFKKKS